MENIGALAVLLAFALAIYAIIGSVTGKLKRNPFLIVSGERAVYGVWFLVTLASAILVSALLTGDFRFSYVAENSNRAMPAIYKFTAWWGGQAGSLLLWSWLLSTYAAVVIVTNRRKHRDFMPYVVAVLSTVWSAGRHVLLPAFDPGAALDLIERERVTVTLVVPSMLAAINEEQLARPRDVSSLELIPFGGAPTATDTLRRAREAFPGVRLLHIYGATELSPIATLLPGVEKLLDRPEVRSCGQPARCAVCGGAIGAEGGAVSCLRCGAPGRCSICSGTSFGIERGGVERIAEWAARIAPSAK